MFLDVRRTVTLALAALPATALAQQVQLSAAAPRQAESLLARPARLQVAELPVSTALLELQRRSDTPIAFSPTLLPRAHRITCACGDVTVGEALDRILAGLEFDYLELAGQIVIEPRRASVIDISTPRPGVLALHAGVTVPPRALEPAGGVARAENAPVERRSLFARLFGPVQHGTVVGIVTARETGQPLSAAQVYLEGTSFAATTGEDGRFVIADVPEGTYTVVARVIGYAWGRSDNVRVRADRSSTVDFALKSAALRLEEVVVTGVLDPVAGIKAPFSVGKLTKEDLPVPTTHSAIASIQGKVPGVSVTRPSGQPGTDVFVQLRSPTSIVRNNAPMFVVDGVILGSTVNGTTVDLESLDIESIEIVKGAAAAALYGSRAASGVVSITTARGRDQPSGHTRITYRSEYGTSELPRGVPLTRSHYFKLDAQGRFVDALGNPVTAPDQRVTDDDRMMDNPYPTPLFDNVRAFYRPGVFQTQSVSLGHNTPATNFLLSGNYYREKGSIVTNDGYRRLNFRMNLDHRVNENLAISGTAYHNRSKQDELSGSPFWDLLMYAPDVDLSRKDASGQFLPQPDPTVPLENPIWRQTSRDNKEERSRTLLSTQARLTPFPWLTLDGTVSYDRSDNTWTIYVPKGVQIVGSDDETDGRLDKEEEFVDVVNASAGATVLWTFGDLTARTSARALMEREQFTRFRADARDFWVQDVPDLDNAQRQNTFGSSQDIRANGYFLSAGLDYAGKYIGDVLVRRDGSSLFGPDARWATYYRISGAYRLAQEPWWPFPALNEFKVRYSRGTAGGRPSFSDQYETWSISSSGAVSKGTLGNRNLRPEYTTEQEFGLDMIFRDRYSLELSYATQKTEDQILQIPQPAVSGYSNQWKNSGTIEGHTWEATLQAQLIQNGDWSWTSTLVADRTRSKITEWNRVCYIPDGGYAFRCLNSNHTEFYGERFLRSGTELPAFLQAYQEAFDVNDDGYLVAVGPGGSFRDGRWGEFVDIGGTSYKWGHPVLDVDELGNPVLQVIGEGFPDFTFGWMNTVRWRNLSVYGQLHGLLGGRVYNRTKQRLYQHFRHADLDQTDKPAELKKPIDYYQTLYEANNTNSHFVERADFVKLRELAVRYTFGPIGRFGMDRITLGLIGRNMFTITNYSGFDPEVSLDTFRRRDNFEWPHTRTITANVEITF